MEKKTNKWAMRGRMLWMYTKYQVISKLIIAVVLIPAFSALTRYLIHRSGRTNLSSGDFMPFLFSINGLLVLLLGLLVIILIMGMDINAFIVISALVKEGKLKVKMKEVLWIGLKSTRFFFTPAGLLLAVWIALILPLVGLGFSLTPFKNFQIPNFITSVIFNTPLYLTLYSIGMIIFTVVTIIYVFTIHYVVIEQEKIGPAMKNSRMLMKKHWLFFIKDYITALLKLALVLAAIGGVILLIFFIVGIYGRFGILGTRVWTIFTMVTMWEFVTYVIFITIPVLTNVVTNLFYKYNEQDGNPVTLKFKTSALMLTDEERTGKIRIRTKLQVGVFIVIVLLANAGVAFMGGYFFDDIFPKQVKMQVIAHRAGGDLAAENTVAGVDAAIREKANWVEIDVQRTADDKYIINHDGSLKRVTGEDKKSDELTMDQVKKLKVHDLFDSSRPDQPVATLDDMLDAAKGRIGMFIELKGATANRKMADDVIKDVKDRHMEKDVVILSLDYPMIEYIADKYPDIQTGYLYYFNVGDLKDLKGNYLIMEEREATPEKIAEIHEAGKKVIVWTVNTPESIEKFVNSTADGVITDHVRAVKQAIRDADERTDFEILVDDIFGA